MEWGPAGEGPLHQAQNVLRGLGHLTLGLQARKQGVSEKRWGEDAGGDPGKERVGCPARVLIKMQFLHWLPA